MKRLGAIGAVMLMVAAVSWAGPTSGQDRADERIAALETQVADHASRIDQLEDQMAALNPGGARAAATPEAEPVTVSGLDAMESDPFSLEAGRYRITATLEVEGLTSGFILRLQGPDGFEELLFNEVIGQAQLSGDPKTWTGSATVLIEEEGEYILTVENASGPWEVLFESF